MVQILPSNAGDTGSIPGQGTKIPHSMEPLSLGALTRERAGIAVKSQHSQKKEKKPVNKSLLLLNQPCCKILFFFFLYQITALKRLFTAFTTYKAKDKNYSYKF